MTSKNISNCKVEDRCVLIQGDWEYVLNQIHEPADLIFIDPPYKAGIIESCLEKIWQRKLLAADGIIAAEHDVRQELPETVGGFSIWKVKNTAIPHNFIFCLTGGYTSMRKALYAGTFDLITNGHLDLIKRASKLCEHLVVGVMENQAKPFYLGRKSENDSRMYEKSAKCGSNPF